MLSIANDRYPCCKWTGMILYHGERFGLGCAGHGGAHAVMFDDYSDDGIISAVDEAHGEVSR